MMLRGWRDYCAAMAKQVGEDTVVWGRIDSEQVSSKYIVQVYIVMRIIFLKKSGFTILKNCG